MTQATKKSLLDLQSIDAMIFEVRQKVAEFEPMLEDVAAEATRLETEVGSARSRLEELRTDERRLENNANDKKLRLNKLDERLNAVRTVREEAAVRAESDLVRRAMETDEHEALSLLDLIRRAEERIETLAAEHEVAAAELEPRRAELLAERTAVEAQLEALLKERDEVAQQVPDKELAFYETIRGKGNRVVVAALTEDGACGNCYAVIPLQLQNEVRMGGALIRCESCGVVLSDFEQIDEADEVEAADSEGSDANEDVADDEK